MKNVLQELDNRIAADCKTVDRDKAFNDMLDECYSFDSVGGPFANMSPSRVLLECDPTAHHCGVNDYADGQEWVEVNGETYQQDDAQKIKDDLVTELEDELETAQNELQEMNEAEDEDKDEDAINEKVALVAELEANLKELEKHEFDNA